MDTDRLDELFDRHLDGALTAAEEAELASALADPEAQRRWRTLAGLEGKLLEEHMAARPEPAALPRRPIAARLRRADGNRSYAGLVAAAALMGIGILLALFASGRSRPGEEPSRIVKETPPEPEAPGKVEPVRETPPDAGEPEPVPIPRETPLPDPPPRIETAPPGKEEAPPPRIVEEPAAPRREPPGATVAAVAVLERLEGKVHVLGGEDRMDARAGQDLLSGHGIETSSRDGLAAVRFPDGTLLEAGPGTVLREILGDPKRLILQRGILAAAVTPQPAGRPLVVETSQAEARVLGTTLTVTAEPDGTRLEVTKGKVRLTRKADGKSVDVAAGHYAVAAPGTDLVSRPIPSRPAVVSFTLIDADTGRPVPGFDPIPEGAVIRLSRLPARRLNIRANLVPSKVGSVRFGLDGTPNSRIENGLSGPIYSLAGDMNGIYNVWKPSPGLHTVTATPYAELNGRGEAGIPLTLTFRIAKE